MDGNPNPDRYQFSRRVVLIGLILLTVALSLITWAFSPGEHQRAAVLRFERLGGRSGTIGYADSHQSPSAPVQFLRNWLPRDYFDSVALINFTDTKIGD